MPHKLHSCIWQIVTSDVASHCSQLSYFAMGILCPISLQNLVIWLVICFYPSFLHQTKSFSELSISPRQQWQKKKIARTLQGDFNICFSICIPLTWPAIRIEAATQKTIPRKQPGAKKCVPISTCARSDIWPCAHGGALSNELQDWAPSDLLSCRWVGLGMSCALMKQRFFEHEDTHLIPHMSIQICDPGQTSLGTAAQLPLTETSTSGRRVQD